MPTSFQSYDLDQNGTISPDEWQQFYALDEGPAPAAGDYGNRRDGDVAAPTSEFNYQDFIDKVSSGTFTDDDMLAFSNWYMGQQLGLQSGQLDYQNRYLDYLGQSLGLNEQQLAMARQEMEFQQGPYWDWYVNSYFPHQQERDQMEYDLAVYNLDVQKQLGQYQVDEAKIRQGQATDYALAQFYNTEQAQLGADAARYQYLQMLEQPDYAGGRSKSLGGY